MLKGWMFLFIERKEDCDVITWLKNMQGRTEGREAKPWHLSTKNERGRWWKVLFRKAFLLPYESLPFSWRALCCLLPSIGIAKASPTEIVGVTSPCPLSSALGTWCLLCQRLSVPLSVCATGKGFHCKLVLRLFDFYFSGKTPLLKLWRKGKLNATDIFTSLLNYSDERES